MYRLFYWILLNRHPYYMSGRQHTDVKRDCPNFVSLAVIKHWQKATWGKKEFIWLPHPDHRISLREIRAGTQAQAEAKSLGESCMLICLPWLAFLYQPETTYTEMATPIMNCILPCQSLMKTNMHPQTCLQSILWEQSLN